MRRKSKSRRLLGASLILGLLIATGGLAGAKGAVRMLSPKPGATLKGEILVKVSVDATDVSYVIFGVDGERPHATNCKPFVFMLDTTQLADGAHTIFAEAYSRAGLVGRSGPVRVIVKNGNIRPAESTPSDLVKAAPPAVSTATKSVKPNVQTTTATTPALTSRAMTPLAERQTTTKVVTAEPRVAAGALSLTQAQTEPPAINQETASVEIAEPPLESSTESTLVLRAGHRQLTINDGAVKLRIAPRIMEGRMQAGFRDIMEAAGWKVDWLPALKSGVADNEERRLVVTLDESQAKIDGQPFDLGGKVSLDQNHLVVPLRPICGAATIAINWDEKTRTARLVAPLTAQTEQIAAAN